MEEIIYQERAARELAVIIQNAGQPEPRLETYDLERQKNKISIDRLRKFYKVAHLLVTDYGSYYV